MKTVYLTSLAITLLNISSGHAKDNLADFIPFSAQAEYGIDKLSKDQKHTLAGWLQEAGVKPMSQGQVTTSTLSMSLYGGKYISLQDGSYWKIAPDDIPIAKGWIAAVPIEVHLAGHNKDEKAQTTEHAEHSKKVQSYSYVLYNTVTKQSIRGAKSSEKEVFSQK